MGDLPGADASVGRAGVVGRRFGLRLGLFAQHAVLPDARGLVAAAGVDHRALALAAAAVEHALVDVAVGIGGGALPVDLAGAPFAFVDEAVGHLDPAFPVALAVDELPGIDGAVGIGRHALAVALPVGPFAD